MVGSTSFSSGARISVMPSFAVQSIAAPCIGCQKDSFWNGRHRGDFTHHGQDHSVDVARGIPTGYPSTVRGSTVQWPLFTFHNFGALVLTIPVFSLEPECSYCAHAYYSTASSWFLSRSFSLQVGVSYVARYCTVPLPSPLLLVVCPQYHHYFFHRMSTTYCTVVLLYYHYLCCCVASCYKYCFFFLSAAA
jgi:hypothetical protein